MIALVAVRIASLELTYRPTARLFSSDQLLKALHPIEDRPADAVIGRWHIHSKLAYGMERFRSARYTETPEH
jgi:hypothetical protein